MPFLIATAEAATATPAASRSVTLPAQVQPVDQVLLVAVATASVAFAALSGWTQLADVNVTSAACRVSVWRRTAQSGDASSAVTPTLASGTADIAVQARVYRGVSVTAPLDATTVSGDSGGANDANTTAPAIATGTPGALVVSFHGIPTSFGTVLAEANWTAPAGGTDEVVTCSTDAASNNGCCAVYDHATTAAGTYGPFTAVSSEARRWGAVTVALRPVSPRRFAAVAASAAAHRAAAW